VGAVLLAFGLSGCGAGSPVERRGVGLETASGDGEGWRLVFAPDEAAGVEGAERSRLNTRLAVGRTQSAYPLDMYPRSEPSLRAYRWIYLPRNPDGFVYFPNVIRPTEGW